MGITGNFIEIASRQSLYPNREKPEISQDPFKGGGELSTVMMNPKGRNVISENMSVLEELVPSPRTIPVSPAERDRSEKV